MPDLFFHFATGYLSIRRLKNSTFRVGFVLGAILPDALARIPEIILGRILEFDVYDFFLALHTPFSLLIVCYATTFIFEEKIRKMLFISLFLGTQVHFLLDIFQEQFYFGVYMPFFPLSFSTIQIPLYGKDSSMILFPALALFVIWCWHRDKATVER